MRTISTNNFHGIPGIQGTAHDVTCVNPEAEGHWRIVPWISVNVVLPRPSQHAKERIMDSDSDRIEPLQFETAIPRVVPAEHGAAGVTCAGCQRTIEDQYFDVNGQPVCESCRGQISQHAETPRGWGVFARTALFGFGAAILGAVLYYAVIAITDFEIGIVAIAIGYMVGYAVRKGARGRGGRRFQVLALVLTYWAVGLAYTPLAFQSMTEEPQEGTTTPGAPASDPQGATDASDEPNVALAVLALLGLTVALPVLSVIGSMPGGLISAAIIAFGMHQAWRMTGVPQVQITGPYQIATERAALT